jgi:hypothetical protein
VSDDMITSFQPVPASAGLRTPAASLQAKGDHFLVK